MVEVIGIQVDLASEELGKAALDERVLAAMRKVPQHRFVPSFLAPLAYQDTPLPIGFDKLDLSRGAAGGSHADNSYGRHRDHHGAFRPGAVPGSC